MTSTRRRIGAASAGVVLLLTALLAVRLGALEREGPAHTDVFIGDGIPATLYLPFDDDDGDIPYQRPTGERPPVVVIAHGYSADQAIMSSMARSLAEAGYATLTFDLRGHGSNTHAFEGDLTNDLDAVVDWVERSPLVDAERITVLGHSMGASAALDFATLDERPRAVIPVSGGRVLHDTVLPQNLLLLVAENDPDRIHDRQAEIAADLEGEGTNVVTSEVAGTDHLSILFSDSAIGEIVEFLDPTMGVERAGAAPGLEDDRLPVAALYVLLVLVVIALLGSFTGRFVAPAVSGGGAGGLVLVAAALVLTTPVMAAGGVNILPLGAGQPVVTQLLVAAGVLWTLRAMVQRGMVTGRVAEWVGDMAWLPLRTAWVPGLAAGFAIFLLFLPVAPITHRLVPTPERFVYWIVVTAMALPFFAAFESLVRRGSAWRALGWAVVGRLVLLVFLVAGLAAGVLPPVLGLVIPLLVGQYVMLELFAGPCFARGRNTAVIAVTESVVVAWFVVTFTPVS